MARIIRIVRIVEMLEMLGRAAKRIPSDWRRGKRKLTADVQPLKRRIARIK